MIMNTSTFDTLSLEQLRTVAGGDGGPATWKYMQKNSKQPSMPPVDWGHAADNGNRWAQAGAAIGGGIVAGWDKLKEKAGGKGPGWDVAGAAAIGGGIGWVTGFGADVIGQLNH
jgi:hypothetical protein